MATIWWGNGSGEITGNGARLAKIALDFCEHNGYTGRQSGIKP